jgi:Protein of unknown function (DUF1236)
VTREPNNPARRGSFWAFMLIGALIFVGGFYALYHRQQAANDPNGMLSRAGGGESIAGKNDTSVDKSNELGRAEDIQKSTRSKVTLSPEQRQRLSEILKGEQQAHQDSAQFTLSIGSKVAPQIALYDLPSAAADVLQGYNGDKYLIVRDQLVIVDAQDRRVVALIPNVS